MKAKLLISSPRVPRSARTTPVRVLLPVLLITFAVLLVSSSADAHGIGYYQIRGAQLPPYVVHAWIAPGVLRTGDVHIDAAVMDADGNPALGTLVQVALIPLDEEIAPLVSLAGSPDPEYPFARGASFRLEHPGSYRLQIGVSDTSGMSGTISDDVEVTTIGWPIKVVLILIFLATVTSGVWLLWQTRAFWVARSTIYPTNRTTKLHSLYLRRLAAKNFSEGGIDSMSINNVAVSSHSKQTFMQRLNGRWHAPALWFYMLVIVAHWLEHVLQIYQIYGLGWEPSKAGGILGVMYPNLVESETLHFVYDFIQWAGIVLLLQGFRSGRARLFWTIAMVVQTWHYIEHVLLMGQYLTGYYLFGAPHQISILQLWFPRAELHFTYNLLVFVPMVIAVHYYLEPKLAELAALNAEKAQAARHAAELDAAIDAEADEDTDLDAR